MIIFNNFQNIPTGFDNCYALSAFVHFVSLLYSCVWLNIVFFILIYSFVWVLKFGYSYFVDVDVFLQVFVWVLKFGYSYFCWRWCIPAGVCMSVEVWLLISLLKLVYSCVFCLSLVWRKGLNSDVQQFYQHKQNELWPLTLTDWTQQRSCYNGIPNHSSW